jgi:hypothetical protein
MAMSAAVRSILPLSGESLSDHKFDPGEAMQMVGHSGKVMVNFR